MRGVWTWLCTVHTASVEELFMSSVMVERRAPHPGDTQRTNRESKQKREGEQKE